MAGVISPGTSTPAAGAHPEQGTVLRRELVPTRRELGQGERAQASGGSNPGRGRASRWPTVRGTGRDFGRRMDPRNIGGPKLPLAVLGASALLTHWDQSALRILLPDMQTDFGLNLEFLITIGVVFEVFSILLAAPTGFLADRVKRIWLIRVGGLLTHSASVAQGLSHSVPGLIACRAAAGVGIAVKEPAGFPLLSDYYPSSSRTRVFAFLGFMGAAGAVIGPTVAGLLGSRFGWRFAVVSLGALATLVSLSYFLLREPTRGYHDRLEMGASDTAARQEQRPIGWTEGWRAARSVATIRRLWYATPFLTAATVGGLVFLSLYYAREFNLGDQERGYIATAQNLAAMLGLLVAAPISDRFLAYRPGRVLNAFGGLMVLLAASIAVVALSHNLILSIIVGLPVGFGFVAIGPALYTLLSLVVPARLRGLGLQTIAPWQLLGLLAVLPIAVVAQNYGIRWGILASVPLYLVAAGLLSSAGGGVESDIRAALAASVAHEESARARAEGRRRILVCRDLDVHFDQVQALAHVDLDVDEGEILAVLGTNGAGKSALLGAIGGTHEASNGAVFFDGDDITHVPPHENAARGITMVLAGQRVFPILTVRENLQAATWVRRQDARGADAVVERVVRLFPVLRERLSQPAGVLSAGEQQMLALGEALVTRPRLLMVDELSLGLAPTIVTQLIEAIRQINAQGTTVILAEQSIDVASRVATRAVVLAKGRIRYDGSPQGLAGSPEAVRSALNMDAGLRLRSGHPPAPDPTRAADDPALEVEGIAVRFGGVEALRGVSVQVRSGEVVGMIGPNGAGKTTLLDVISGFVPAGAGAVRLAGRSLSGERPDARARLGLARSFQDAELFPFLTVRENILVGLEPRLPWANPAAEALWTPEARRFEKRARERADALLSLTGLGGMGDRFASELPAGARRALNLACVMATEPSVLLLDEPSSGLGRAETAELGFLLGRLVREARCGLLLVDHDMSLIASVCDRVAVLALGEVIASGAPAQVLSDPRVVRAYMSGATAADDDSQSPAIATTATAATPPPGGWSAG